MQKAFPRLPTESVPPRIRLGLRGVLTYVALAIFLSTSALAAYKVMRIGLPERGYTDPTQLREWLATHTATEETDERKLQIARRLEHHFRYGTDWDSQLRLLNDAERMRFDDNYIEVTRVWFLDKVDRYYETPEDEREEYLDGQIDNITRWQRLLPVTPEDVNEVRGGGVMPAGLVKFFYKVSSWAEEATPQERDRIRQFVKQFADRMKNRQIDRMRGMGLGF